MSYSATASSTHTYTNADVEVVVRRFTADIVMIAQSTGALTEAKARDYAHDVEVLAKKGYLKSVDLTLLSGTTEVQAVQYTVNTEAGDLTTGRPDGVMWPRVNNPYLRILVYHNSSYTSEAENSMRDRLRINWIDSTADTSHAALKASGGRDYVSNGFGMQRKDFAA